MNFAQQTAFVKSPATEKPARPSMFEVQKRIRRSDLPRTAQALLCAILDHDRYGASRLGCIATIGTLAGEINATTRTVTRLLPGLLAGRWITMDRRSGSKYSPWRAFRMGPACTECTPRQEVLGADQEVIGAHLDNPGLHLDIAGTAPRQPCPAKRLEETEKEIEFAGGEDFAPPQEDESGPEPVILKFPTLAGPELTPEPSQTAVNAPGRVPGLETPRPPDRPISPPRAAQPPRDPSKFPHAPTQRLPIQQNYNPPAPPPPPDDDPAETARVIAAIRAMLPRNGGGS